MIHEDELTTVFSQFLGGKLGIAQVAYLDMGPSAALEARQKELLLSQKLKQGLQEKFQKQGTTSVEQVRMSLSHSRVGEELWGVAIGVALGVGEKRLTLGIDLEHRSRTVHPQILCRITTEEERAFLGRDVLKYWVVKEAAFKANPQNQGTVIPDYVIENQEPHSQILQVSLRNSIQAWKCRIQLIETPTWYIAIGYSTDGQR
jgi:phosphopantetheinyl transferase (holo-ACP synthase)